MKKNLLRVAIVVIILSMCFSCIVFAGESKIKVGIVADVGGRGDRSFNDSALHGLEAWAGKVEYVRGGGYRTLSDAEYEASIPDDLKGKDIHVLNITPVVLESKAQEDYIPNFIVLTEQEKCDLVVGVGFMQASAVGEVAKSYPDTKFVLVDAIPVDNEGNPLELDNVLSTLYSEYECGFLAGAIAGYATKSGKLGYIGGIKVPAVLKYEAGYRAGIKTTNPEAVIIGQYVESFNEPTLGKMAAITQIGQGCDVIFHAAGAVGNGMFQAICEKGAPYWAIGVDVDQGLDPHLCPDRTLTCAMKHVDYSVYLGIKALVEDGWKGGPKMMSLKDGGVAYAQDHVADVLTQEQIDKVEHLREMIIAGEIQVPNYPKYVDDWIPPTDF